MLMTRMPVSERSKNETRVLQRDTVKIFVYHATESYAIMSAKEKQAAAEQTFVFLSQGE